MIRSPASPPVHAVAPNDVMPSSSRTGRKGARPSFISSMSVSRATENSAIATYCRASAPQLRDQALEHRVGPRAVDVADRRLPHPPPLDERVADEQPDDLQVDRADLLERAELLEVVELAVEDVGLAGVGGDVAGVRLRAL